MKKLFLSFLLLSLCGCMVGPNYTKPTMDTPKEWRVSTSESQNLANTRWWEQFNDPVLNNLIETALKQNNDLLIATSRIDEYLAKYKTTRADIFPQLNGQASAGRQQTTQTISAADRTTTDLAAGLNVSWELDLWGKLRRSNEAAKADYLSKKEAQQAVILSLVANVANAYIGLLSLDQQLQISKDTLKTREESLTLFQTRFEGGLISEVELLQSKSEYYSTRALIPTVESAIAQQENAICVLLGQNPGPIPRGKTFEEFTVPLVPSGLPSQILEQRPDILQAEQQLIAANARIGAAQAQYFPTISLTGSTGTSSAELSNLFSGPAATWSYAGSAAGPIFNAGKTKGQVDAAKAQKQQALFSYFAAIQNAFREVNNGLVAQQKIKDELSSQGEQVKTLEQYNSLAWLRYTNGYTDYLEVLDAQRNLFSTRLTFTQTKEKLLNEMVNLYKAMGGGWGLGKK